MWSISCCWEGKGSLRIAGMGLIFRNWLSSSRRRHSFVKWSPPHSRHGYFAFLFPLSFLLRVGFGFSSWFLGFFVFSFTFLFIVVRCLNTLNRIDLGGNLGSQRNMSGSLGLLGRFRYWQGMDWTNNPINRYFYWWLGKVSVGVSSLRNQVIKTRNIPSLGTEHD